MKLSNIQLMDVVYNLKRMGMSERAWGINYSDDKLGIDMITMPKRFLWIEKENKNVSRRMLESLLTELQEFNHFSIPSSYCNFTDSDIIVLPLETN